MSPDRELFARLAAQTVDLPLAVPADVPGRTPGKARTRKRKERPEKPPGSLPTPQEIEERSEAIRATWTHKRRRQAARQRRVGVQVVKMGDVQ